MTNVSGALGTTPALDAATSFQPGVCQFAFANGSSRFIKNSIDSWAIDPTIGLSINPTTFNFDLAPGTRVGVYQAPSTRNWGEIIDSDAY